MDISCSHQDNISGNTRKRGQGKMKLSGLHTSPHVSLPQKRPVGRPRKDGYIGPSNKKCDHILVQQKRPVGRPTKVHINPISNNGKVGQLESPTKTKTPQCHGTYNDPYAKFRPLLPRLSNQYTSSLINSLIHGPSSSQLSRGIGHSYDDNRNGVIGTSSRHSKDNSVNLLSSFDDVNDSESHEYGEDDMIDDENEIDENGEDFSNSEDAIENDTVMSQAHRGTCCYNIVVLHWYVLMQAIDQTISTSTVIDQKPVFETLNFLDLNLPAPDEGNGTSVIEFSPWWIESNHQHDSFLSFFSN
ncbi:hypothetical protein POM88_044250 [Heracleum sosnowskyi]|uniref:Uncharacterized protein n=1 Tax=Heracleum sosnowskyi TaxID=360622 RepID=A0AAD8M3S8_9APIA|nr:hypothetical protein POM88_044250 [Heracleum sosnowskyi]